jgi:hypothetical protein
MRISNRFAIAATALATTAILTFSACHRLKNEDSEDTGYANDHATVEKTFSDVQDIADQAATSGSLSTYKIAGGTPSVLSGCATITHDTTVTPHKLTIDFGTSNCLCADGNYRRGQIIVTYTGRYRDPNHQHDITFNNYFVNDNQITGTKSVTRVADDSAGHPVYTISISGQVILANNAGTITSTSTRTRTWVAGYNTAAWNDDEYDLTGSGSVTRASGKVFSYQITTPLHIALSCRWIESGVVTITPQGAGTRTLDYGNGTCDAQANLTVNGKTYSVSLR